MMGLEMLTDSLASISSGMVEDTAGLDHLLASCWDDLHGSDGGGMQASKLIGRMEDIHWEPPILRFFIGRHGGAACGSSREELQHWEVDLDAGTAEIVKTGHRQLAPMAARAPIKAMAEEICEAILSGKEDDRIRRSDDGSVKVLASEIFPTDSGCKRTVAGRRKRLVEQVEEILQPHRWKKFRGNIFCRSQE